MIATAAPVEVPLHSSASRNPDANADRVTRLTRGASVSLAHLSDSELLTRTQHLVGKSNQVFAALLDHLAEVEARGLYRQRACASLYTYCIYELRFSEDAAARRSGAAKLARRFPAVLAAVSTGEIHLTGLLMLGPHLTEENHLELLARAKFRTKKEISQLIRRVAPLPWVPDRVEPLGPAPVSRPTLTWPAFLESLCPIRTAPRLWNDESLHAHAPATENEDGSTPTHDATAALLQRNPETTALARENESMFAGNATAASLHKRNAETTALARENESMFAGNATAASLHKRNAETTALARENESEREPVITMGIERAGALGDAQTNRTAPARGEWGSTGDSVSEEHVDRAGEDGIAMHGRGGEEQDARMERESRATSPERELYLMQFTTTAEHAELVERARALLSYRNAGLTLGELHLQAMRLFVESVEKERFGASGSIEARAMANRNKGVDASPPLTSDKTPGERRKPVRHVPARLRRAVYERDGKRCAYVDERGVRCSEAHFLEIHHLHAWALGGKHELRNLSLRCRAHNALAAEQDLGRKHIERQREGTRHGPERRILHSGPLDPARDGFFPKP